MITTRLDVVNACLAIMGEAPLNSLNEDHQYRDAAITLLDSNLTSVQAPGWWYNRESLYFAVSPEDNRIYIPGDVDNVLFQDPALVARGRVVYNLDAGTDRFPSGYRVAGLLIRTLSLDLLPVSIAKLIKMKTVLEFQTQFDGDSTKTRQLYLDVYGDAQRLGLMGEAKAEDIRNARINMFNSNSRVGRLRNYSAGFGTGRVWPSGRTN